MKTKPNTRDKQSKRRDKSAQILKKRREIFVQFLFNFSHHRTVTRQILLCTNFVVFLFFTKPIFSFFYVHSIIPIAWTFFCIKNLNTDHNHTTPKKKNLIFFQNLLDVLLPLTEKKRILPAAFCLFILQAFSFFSPLNYQPQPASKSKCSHHPLNVHPECVECNHLDVLQLN